MNLLLRLRLYSRDGFEREDAAVELARRGSAAGVAVLLAAARKAREAGQGRRDRIEDAVVELRERAARRVVKTLVGAGSGGEASTQRELCGDVLRRMGEAGLPALREAGASAVEALERVLLEDEARRARTWREIQCLRNCAALLRSLGATAVTERLLTSLQSGDEGLAKGASVVFEEIPDPRAVPFLIPLLRSTQGPVVAQAARALGRAGDRQAVRPLIEALGTDDEPALNAVAAALAALGDRTAASPLSPVLERLLRARVVNWQVIATIARFLGEAGDGSTTRSIRRALQDAGWHSDGQHYSPSGKLLAMRDLARTMVQLGDPEAADVLTGLLGYPGLLGEVVTLLASLRVGETCGVLLTMLVGAWEETDRTRNAYDGGAMGPFGLANDLRHALIRFLTSAPASVPSGVLANLAELDLPPIHGSWSSPSRGHRLPGVPDEFHSEDFMLDWAPVRELATQELERRRR
jgi:hypothetical protein